MSANPAIHQIRKYPNRRYYDISTSRHMTLDEIYELVRTGGTIHVTDSNTGGDITSYVLTQIIFEREGSKLDVFPAGLLHQVIQANQNVLHSFIERYFSGALNAFLQNQSRFEEFLQRAGVPPAGLAPFQWARTLMNPGRPETPDDGSTPATRPSPATPEASPSGSSAIEELRGQLELMQQQLQQIQAQNDLARPRRGRKPKRGGS